MGDQSPFRLLWYQDAAALRPLGVFWWDAGQPCVWGHSDSELWWAVQTELSWRPKEHVLKDVVPGRAEPFPIQPRALSSHQLVHENGDTPGSPSQQWKLPLEFAPMRQGIPCGRKRRALRVLGLGFMAKWRNAGQRARGCQGECQFRQCPAGGSVTELKFPGEGG